MTQSGQGLSPRANWKDAIYYVLVGMAYQGAVSDYQATFIDKSAVPDRVIEILKERNSQEPDLKETSQGIAYQNEIQKKAIDDLLRATSRLVQSEPGKTYLKVDASLAGTGGTSPFLAIIDGATGEFFMIGMTSIGTDCVLAKDIKN